MVIGCSKGTNQNSTDAKTEITGSVIEDSKENCRFGNESDCRPIEIRRGDAENEEYNNTKETANLQNNSKKIINISEDILLSNCEAGSKCVEAKYRAYQYSNCSWTSIEYCVYGCKDGVCKPSPICKQSSLKCSNDVVMKCSEDGSEWKTNESCDYHCENGICISKNETMTNSTNSTNNATLTNATAQNNFILDGCMGVLKYNLTGNNATDEYFTLKNSCSYQIDMAGWTASDASSHAYTFPAFNLAGSWYVTIVTGSGINNQTTLYWGRSSAVWNNNGDTLYLNISNGTSVLIKSLAP